MAFSQCEAFCTRAVVGFVAILALKFPQTDLHGPCRLFSTCWLASKNYAGIERPKTRPSQWRTSYALTVCNPVAARWIDRPAYAAPVHGAWWNCRRPRCIGGRAG